MSEFFVYIKDQKITNRKTVANQFALPDGSYLVTIKSKKHRSLNQNRFWWGALLPLVKMGLNDAGYSEVKTVEDAHEVLKALFLKKHISNPDGLALEMSGSTAELTTVEFNELIEKVQMWASDFLGVVIPNPGEPMIMFTEFDNEVKATIIE